MGEIGGKEPNKQRSFENKIWLFRGLTTINKPIFFINLEHFESQKYEMTKNPQYSRTNLIATTGTQQSPIEPAMT